MNTRFTLLKSNKITIIKKNPTNLLSYFFFRYNDIRNKVWLTNTEVGLGAGKYHSYAMSSFTVPFIMLLHICMCISLRCMQPFTVRNLTYFILFFKWWKWNIYVQL